MNIFWYDWVGYLGVVLVLLAFFLLQAHRLRGNGLIYQLMNVAGALCVIVSLGAGIGPINWPVFLMQLAWIVISIFGIVVGSRRRRTTRDSEAPRPSASQSPPAP